MYGASVQVSGRRAAAGAALGLCAAGVVVAATGHAVLPAAAAAWAGATGLGAGLGGGFSAFVCAQSLARITPLLFCGLAVAVGLRSGLFNIGGQGQMIAGGLCAAVAARAAPPPVAALAAVTAGCCAGALWALPAAWLKRTRGVHEVITTILLNYVAMDLAGYCVTHALRDPASMAPQTPAIPRAAWLAPLVPGANLTLGLVVAAACAAALDLALRRTAWGFRLRATGAGIDAARAAGIPVERVRAAAMGLSGALVGLAGAIEVLGVHHRYVDGLAATYGFDGIAVALLGGLSGVGSALAAAFFGGLANGAAYLQLRTDVPESIALVVQAAVVLFAAVRVAPRVLRRLAPRSVGSG